MFYKPSRFSNYSFEGHDHHSIKTYPHYNYLYTEGLETGDYWISGKSPTDSTYVSKNLGDIHRDSLFTILTDSISES